MRRSKSEKLSSASESMSDGDKEVSQADQDSTKPKQIEIEAVTTTKQLTSQSSTKQNANRVTHAPDVIIDMRPVGKPSENMLHQPESLEITEKIAKLYDSENTQHEQLGSSARKQQKKQPSNEDGKAYRR